MSLAAMRLAKQKAEAEAKARGDAAPPSGGAPAPPSSGGGAPSSSGGGGGIITERPIVKMTGALIRINKDLAELDINPRLICHETQGAILAGADPLKQTWKITPDAGYWCGAGYSFEIEFGKDYPISPPKVKCLVKIYHPNIDLSGSVCLNILRKEWMPVLTLQDILHGLCSLFFEPNPLDPLNHEAAQVMRDSSDEFKRNVDQSLRGNPLRIKAVDGKTGLPVVPESVTTVSFPKLLK